MEEEKYHPEKDVDIKRPVTPTISAVLDLPGSAVNNAILLDSPPAGVQASRNEADNDMGYIGRRAASRVPIAPPSRNLLEPRVGFVKNESKKKSESSSSTPIRVSLGTVRSSTTQPTPRQAPKAPTVTFGANTRFGRHLNSSQDPHPGPSARFPASVPKATQTTSIPVSSLSLTALPDTSTSTGEADFLGVRIGKNINPLGFPPTNQSRFPFP